MYYVTMIDDFMSGWGKAEGKTNIYMVCCDTLEQAEIIKKNAKKRSEMRNIKIKETEPYYGKGYLVSEKRFIDLGDIWTQE